MSNRLDEGSMPTTSTCMNADSNAVSATGEHYNRINARFNAHFVLGLHSRVGIPCVIARFPSGVNQLYRTIPVNRHNLNAVTVWPKMLAQYSLLFRTYRV